MAKTSAFENHSDAYDEWFDINADLYAIELATVRELLPEHPEWGMEVGVGSGKFSAPLGLKTGVEPCEEMAAKARRRGIDVHPGVAEALPFNDESFPFILSVTTICFVDDVAKTFAESFRVLQPGGSLLVGFVDRESELGRKYQANKEKSRFYQEATFFSTQELLDALTAAGFTDLHCKQSLIPGAPEGTVRNGHGEGAFVVIKGTATK